MVILNELYLGGRLGGQGGCFSIIEGGRGDLILIIRPVNLESSEKGGRGKRESQGKKGIGMEKQLKLTWYRI